MLFVEGPSTNARLDLTGSEPHCCHDSCTLTHGRGKVHQEPGSQSMQELWQLEGSECATPYICAHCSGSHVTAAAGGLTQHHPRWLSLGHELLQISQEYTKAIKRKGVRKVPEEPEDRKVSPLSKIS